MLHRSCCALKGVSAKVFDGHGSRGDSLDLRGDIEQRKNYSSPGQSAAENCGSTEEKPAQMFSKCLQKSLTSKKSRSRSSSSSSSSSSETQNDVVSPTKTEQGINRVKLDAKESLSDRGRSYGAFQVQIRGRSWSRGSFRSNPTNTTQQVSTKHEDWDPEYTPKSKKYYLHDDRDSDAAGRWTDTRGRGQANSLRGRPRFIIRKANTNYISSKWAQANRDQPGSEQDHREPR